MIGPAPAPLRRREKALCVLAGAAVLTLAGCGGSSSGAAAPSSSAAATSPAASTSDGSSASGGVGGLGGRTTATPSSAPAATTNATAAGGGVSGQSCPSVALVKATLGLQVGAPAENATVPNVLVCSYPVGANPSAAIVRIQGGQTRAGFAAARAAFVKSGQKTVDVAGMFDGAYRSELGSPTYGVTRTLVVLRGSTEVLVTAGSTYTGLTELAHTMLD